MSVNDRNADNPAFQVVGTSLRRREGLLKVTGQAKYADDLIFEDCLYGKTIRSTVARGLIRDIRFSEGVPWEEFVIVLLADIPGRNAVQLIDDKQPLLADVQIRHFAEPVALIAHTDRELLEKAARYIKVEARELPAIHTIEESQVGDVTVDGQDNLFKSYLIESGDLEAAFGEADLVIEELYRTGPQEQLYIEPNVMIARSSPGESITIWGSMQCPFYIQTALAPIFDLDPDKIRVIQAETGGAFGGKEEYPNMIAGHAALLSWKSGGQPVKILYDRREDLLATTKRHPSRTRIKAGFRKAGTATALEVDFDLDAGAYPTLSAVVLSRGILHSWGPYRWSSCRLRARAWATNSVPYGAFRGFGAPQSVFALETHLSRAAKELGMDPAELRRKNLYRQGDHMPTGQLIRDEIDLEMMLDQALQASNYTTKRQQFSEVNRSGGSTRKGIGLSIFFHGAGFTGSGEDRLASRLAMTLTREGKVEVLAANVEYGQGTQTTFTQIASESCRIPPDWIHIRQPDTRIVENSGPTVASRTSMVVGGLVRRASQKLVSELRSHSELAPDYEPGDFLRAARTYFEKHDSLKVVVQYEPPPGVRWNDATYQGDAYSAYSWSCDVAEVEVDLIDYSVRVTDFVSVVECGRVINPLLAKGPIEGGIAQGLGFALYEECVMQNGAMQNNQYTNYIIPRRPMFLTFESSSSLFQSRILRDLVPKELENCR